MSPTSSESALVRRPVPPVYTPQAGRPDTASPHPRTRSGSPPKTTSALRRPLRDVRPDLRPRQRRADVGQRVVDGQTRVDRGLQPDRPIPPPLSSEQGPITRPSGRRSPSRRRPPPIGVAVVSHPNSASVSATRVERLEFSAVSSLGRPGKEPSSCPLSVRTRQPGRRAPMPSRRRSVPDIDDDARRPLEESTADSIASAWWSRTPSRRVRSPTLTSHAASP